MHGGCSFFTDLDAFDVKSLSFDPTSLEDYNLRTRLHLPREASKHYVAHPYHHAVDGRMDTLWMPEIWEGRSLLGSFFGLDLLSVRDSPNIRIVCSMLTQYRLELSLDTNRWHTLPVDQYQSSAVDGGGLEVLLRGVSLPFLAQSFRYVRLVIDSPPPSPFWVAETTWLRAGQFNTM